MAIGVLCDSWGFCVSVVILLECLKKVLFFKHIFLILLHISFNLKCTVTSHYFVVVLNQTTDVKTLPIAHVTLSAHK